MWYNNKGDIYGNKRNKNKNKRFRRKTKYNREVSLT